MLKFNIIVFTMPIWGCLYLNTSYVKVQLVYCEQTGEVVEYLNTSYVKVQC